MYNFKKKIINFLILSLLSSLLIGCSNKELNNIQPLTPNSKNTTNVTSTSPMNDKASNDLKEKTPNPGYSKLESWIGNYSFSEFSPPDQNMFYFIFINKEKNGVYAQISIDGFQTLNRLQAEVIGDENSIKFVFEKYLPGNMYEPYKKGDILLSFEKRDSKIFTTWGKIEPILETNNKPGEYFKNEKK